MTHILLVDDDEAVLSGLVKVLERSGYSVTSKSSLTQAMEFLDSNDTALDLCIVDMWLADEDGLDLIRALNSNGASIPIVVISGGGPGRTLEHVIAAANALGATATLQKPFTGEELLDVIEDAVS